MTTDGSAKSHWWNNPAGQRAVKTAARGVATAIPVLLVNATAFSAQFAFFRDHLHWVAPGQVMAALALESIAIYLAFHAHLAQLANDSAFRLKVGSYVMGAIIGAINYNHYAGPNWRPTVIAVVMALMSGSSPWLWSIHSRRASRDKLHARGLLDEHAVRLGATRWTWHPVLSVKVMRSATWAGITDPKRAIRMVETKFAVPDLPEDSGTPGTPQLAQPEQRAIGSVPPPDEEPGNGGQRAGVPGPDVPPEGDSVPSPASVPPAVTYLIRPPVPPTPGEPDRVPVASGSAHLTADATMPRRNNHPPQEVIDAAELHLASLPTSDLPSIRKVAEDLLHDPQQRRLAKKLLEGRLHAETQRLDAPPGETVNGSAPAAGLRQVKPGDRVMISPPVRFEPGGGVSG